MGRDLSKVLIPEEELQTKVRELAGRIDADTVESAFHELAAVA